MTVSNIESRDRLYASLPYLLPMSAVVYFGASLLQQFLPLEYLFFPFIWLYGNVLMLPVVPLLGLNGEFLILVGLYVLVIRNTRINHFVRFNAMQAILLEIVIFLMQLILRLSAEIAGYSSAMSLIFATLFNTVFLGIVGVCVYAIAQNIAGKYSEIPTISEAALMQCE
ncbi:Tic20 family protein [Pseudanabaena sp. PCC 6802]|uniref:Tic20 family protein n=1 Tax=Pseudanabaena sp. PCC 6802 TaxID=118173 RepID=UPI000348C598|nr:Tic20 family protein [Pseudanabaena sp. PCC 6802]